jgi:hypothetical protein
VQRRIALRDWRLAFTLPALIYIGLRMAAFLPSSTRTFPDSGVYLHVARQPLVSSDFLAGWRGWTVPLLYKLLPNSDGVRAAGQVAISIACWLTLAGVVAACVRRRVMQPIAFSLVLLFSLSIVITQWDPLILSESIALSLAALLFAAWLVLARGLVPVRWAVTAVLLTTLLWTFTRDTNAYVGLFAVPIVIAWAAFPGDRRSRFVLACGLLAIFGTFAISLNQSSAETRWEIPLLDTIGVRVLTDDDELRYVRDHGMPYPARLRALTGEPLGSSEFRDVIAGNPRLAAFRDWIRDDGRSTLIRFLLSHPYRALSPAFRDREAQFAESPPPSDTGGYSPVSSYRADGSKPLLPGPLASAIYPPSVAALLAWLGAVIAAAAWMAWRGWARLVWVVPAAILLAQIPHAALVWQGEPVEIPRHALQVGVLTRLSLLILTIFLIDAALGAHWVSRRTSRATTERRSDAVS